MSNWREIYLFSKTENRKKLAKWSNTHTLHTYRFAWTTITLWTKIQYRFLITKLKSTWFVHTKDNFPRVVYASDRSKAVVPVLFLFCMALWFILRGASCFKVFLCSLSSCFVIPFSIVITSLVEEGAGLCASRAFVLYVLVSSFWCRGLAAVCDCGIPWTFLLIFLNGFRSGFSWAAKWRKL